MAAARSPVRGLSSDDLETIRDALAAGRKPRVLFTEAAGQMSGQSGQVVALTDPELSDEWVVVRFGKDELPFSPTDLAVPGKGAAARKVEPKAEPKADKPVPELKIVRETPRKVSVPAPRKEEKVSTVETRAAPAEAAGGSVNGGQPDAHVNGKPVRKVTGKPAKAKTPAALTVTLAYADGDWTVAATQGSKALAKPHPIRPSDALKMVGLLDAPGVQDAVEQILTAERTDAEQQASRLRAELAEIEAKLAELRTV
jgi:hypothetical protein